MTLRWRRERTWSVVRLLVLALVLGSVPVLAQPGDDTLVGVIDFHCHSGPTLGPAR